MVGSARDQIRDECHDDGSRHASAKCSRECQKFFKNTRASGLYLASPSAASSARPDALRVHLRLQEAAVLLRQTSAPHLLSKIIWEKPRRHTEVLILKKFIFIIEIVDFPRLSFNICRSTSRKESELGDTRAIRSRQIISRIIKFIIHKWMDMLSQNNVEKVGENEIVIQN